MVGPDVFQARTEAPETERPHDTSKAPLFREEMAIRSCMHGTYGCACSFVPRWGKCESKAAQWSLAPRMEAVRATRLSYSACYVRC
ncbi:hypothetical protein BRADI_2g25085v3 [Brachypodium distachyon]|uniref:Uncharacterized protein n=1 Tax=Brachypodium distachyon TaxID=15368 RepID=A0A2K2DAD9_BRADI|nr:hypothetical protein BRADI_2g25085v3 [Brachypodium distachyon]